VPAAPKWPAPVNDAPRSKLYVPVAKAAEPPGLASNVLPL
jgi:hypothetical protein